MKAGDIGHDCRHRPAGNGFFHGPEQLGDGFWPRKDQVVGGYAEMHEARSIGHAHLLRFVEKLKDNEAGPTVSNEPLCECQGKPQRCSTISFVVREYLAQRAMRNFQKTGWNGLRPSPFQHRPCFQCRDLVAQVLQLFLTRAQHGEGSLRPDVPLENK